MEHLESPAGRISIVLDTDTYNEIDDQFALVQALLSPERFQIEAIYAAPFHADDSINDRSESPADGMEKSYAEILRLLARLGRCPDGFVFRGATGYLPAPDTPVESEAVDDLIARAMADREGPLYVVAIAAITNIASAILKEPRIIERIVVVWLGGHPLEWPTAEEFNLMQDVPAAQVLFDCGVPLILVPCKNVAEHLTTSVPELDCFVRGKSAIGDCLCDSFAAYTDDPFAWTKEVWDIATIAWLINPGWAPSEIVPSPVLTDDMRWKKDLSRHPIRVVTDLRRNPVFRDLFKKLERYADGEIVIALADREAR